MNPIGHIIRSRSANQSAISRKTGISKARINQLCNNPKAKLMAVELYLILLAVEADICIEIKKIFKDTKLIPQPTPDKDSQSAPDKDDKPSEEEAL